MNVSTITSKQLFDDSKLNAKGSISLRSSQENNNSKLNFRDLLHNQLTPNYKFDSNVSRINGSSKNINASSLN